MKSDHVPGNAFSMEKEQIRKLGYEIVDIITDELDDPARRPIYPRPYDWDELEPVLGGDAPEYGQDPHELLRVVTRHPYPGQRQLYPPAFARLRFLDTITDDRFDRGPGSKHPIVSLHLEHEPRAAALSKPQLRVGWVRWSVIRTPPPGT